MSSTEALKVFFGVLAVIVSIPAVLLLVKAGMFFGSLAKSVQALETAATSFGTRVEGHLETLTETVGDHETRITVLEKRKS